MAGPTTRSGERYVGLLRGINVGGRGKLKMAALRSLFASLGYEDVGTFIQSGNVIFSSRRPPDPDQLSAAIATTFAITTTVVLRTHRELADAIANSPFPSVVPSDLHIGFMARSPAADEVGALDKERFLPDHFAVVGSEVYLCLPGGVAQSKLPGYLDRQLKVPITMRNWNTVNRLVELTDQ